MKDEIIRLIKTSMLLDLLSDDDCLSIADYALEHRSKLKIKEFIINLTGDYSDFVDFGAEELADDICNLLK